jgi:imidazolonepropionase
MSSILIKNIRSLEMVLPQEKTMLRGSEMKQTYSIENAFVLVDDGIIKSFGSNAQAPENADEIIDATARFVLPAWCDSHTHLVYAGSREAEFVDKINGLSYEEIAKRGGGILNSATRLNETSEAELVEAALARLDEIRKIGTAAVEIKSGYGLTLQGELKMLRVIRQLKSQSPLTIKSTFLGAHTYPAAFKNNHEGYIKMLVDEMLPAIAAEGLADFIDVFCDKGFFSPDETARILAAGVKHGLVPKLHANELGETGGIETGVEFNARSVDHLEHTSDYHINLLNASPTMPVLLPSTAFFLKLPYAPARKMIDEGLPVALATDYNPGSSPSGNMPFVLSLACIHMRMLPAETLAAATINGAYSMQVENELGSITIGKKANLIITKPIDSLAFIPYSFGSNLVERVIVNGK